MNKRLTDVLVATFFQMVCLSITSVAQSSAEHVDLASIAACVGACDTRAVFDALGAPVSTNVDSSGRIFKYLSPQQMLALHFNDQDTLVYVVSELRSSKSQISLRDSLVRKARRARSSAEIIELLGAPGRITINLSEEQWYYRQVDDKNGEQILVFRFSKQGTNKTWEMRYESNVRRVAKLEQIAIDQLKTGMSRIVDVAALWGAPAKLTITARGEQWSYESNQASLQLSFDAAGKLTDYTVETDE